MGQGRVCIPSWTAGRSQEALPQVLVGSESPPEVPGVDGSTTRRSGWGRETSSEVLGGSGAKPKVWVDRLEVCEGSGGPPSGPGGVGSHYRTAGRHLESLPNSREGSGVPSKGPGEVGRPTGRSGKGREAIP